MKYAISEEELQRETHLIGLWTNCLHTEKCYINIARSNCRPIWDSDSVSFELSKQRILYEMAIRPLAADETGKSLHRKIKRTKHITFCRLPLNNVLKNFFRKNSSKTKDRLHFHPPSSFQFPVSQLAEAASGRTCGLLKTPAGFWQTCTTAGSSLSILS